MCRMSEGSKNYEDKLDKGIETVGLRVQFAVLRYLVRRSDPEDGVPWRRGRHLGESCSYLFRAKGPSRRA